MLFLPTFRALLTLLPTYDERRVAAGLSRVNCESFHRGSVDWTLVVSLLVRSERSVCFRCCCVGAESCIWSGLLSLRAFVLLASGVAHSLVSGGDPTHTSTGARVGASLARVARHRAPRRFVGASCLDPAWTLSKPKPIPGQAEFAFCTPEARLGPFRPPAAGPRALVFEKNSSMLVGQL